MDLDPDPFAISLNVESPAPSGRLYQLGHIGFCTAD
jgi:hypothetical protein